MSVHPSSQPSSTAAQKNKRHTLQSLRALYQSGEKLSMLTAYDVVTARLLDQSDIEMLLVGDSLGNVILGYEHTIPVTLDAMILHTAAVVRGTEKALVICDLPFGSYATVDRALTSGIRAFQETNCQALKLEGGAWAAPIVRALTEQGMPVMGHIGLTPQSIHQLGGFYRHGKTEAQSEVLKQAALALQEAGAFAIVLECLVPELAREITASLKIPTIGIGSGPDCSGQVLVINDLIGLSTQAPPSFAKPRADVASVIKKAAGEFRLETKGKTVSTGGSA